MNNQFGLKEDEAASLQLAEQNPIRRGLSTLFDGVRNGEILDATSPNLSSDQRHFNAGRLAMLIHLEGFLELIYEGSTGGGLDDHKV